MKARASRAGARLRRRKAKLDVRIARAKRTIKTLQRKLRRETGMLTKRQAARRKM
jgi:hypothetical protein